MRPVHSALHLLVGIALLAAAARTPLVAQTAGGAALGAWKDGPAKKAVLDFVTAVTTAGSRDFVPPEDRVATFDNDGTLWCEKPLVEGVFALEQFRALLPKHPEWKDRQPFKAIIEK